MTTSPISRIKRIALIGNPNSGKSTLFNALTGLNQKISNYPGVTVDKKSGFLRLSADLEVELIDFPGIYSLYPNSGEEKIVVEQLTNVRGEAYPDAIVYVATSLELDKHFLLATQLRELNIPMLFCLSMSDLANERGVDYNAEELSTYLEGVEIIKVSSLQGTNIDAVKYHLIRLCEMAELPLWSRAASMAKGDLKMIEAVAQINPSKNGYQRLLISHHASWLSYLSASDRIHIVSVAGENDYKATKRQIDETLSRYREFGMVLRRALKNQGDTKPTFTERIDDIVAHRLIGPILFFAVMFFVFQAIYAWSEWPMNLIEQSFAAMGSFLQSNLPAGWMTNLLTDGILAGLGGIIIFIPQIAILFFLVAFLEESGYMSRAVFMFDGFMQRFGLNGRSLVALVSGGACAIPAIMSTRTIANWKERLITIMVTPLISCSARIPVYTVLIAFVVPKDTIWGIFNAQGLAFMGLYILSIVSALLSAFVFKKILKSREKSFLMIELPSYKRPVMRNILMTIKEKVSAFVVEAGKVIFVISIILWFLSSYGPGDAMQQAEKDVLESLSTSELSEEEIENVMATQRLEFSYAGYLGKWIEPVITPLGFDWKIGIALITSFAAREVFVGTMATIYSVGNTDDTLTIREKMAEELNDKTGGKRYDMPTALSLLLFYVFAMQCMSTLAVTKRETSSWKWPLIQFAFMTALAYLSSFIVYQSLS